MKEKKSYDELTMCSLAIGIFAALTLPIAYNHYFESAARQAQIKNVQEQLNLREDADEGLQLRVEGEAEK